MTDTPNVIEMLRGARNAVRDTNWSAWQIPPGDLWLATRWAPDQPPLTNRILHSYLLFCGWVWRRTISSEEQKRVENGLIRRWTLGAQSTDYSHMYDILSLIWFQGGLQGINPDHREDMRRQLAESIPDGSFPGIDGAVPGGIALEAAWRHPQASSARPSRGRYPLSRP